MIEQIAIAGYRSIRSLVLRLGPLNLVTGPNGSGKSNLYRALRLLADTADGKLVSSLAREGGLSSTLWAGPEAISDDVLAGQSPAQPLLRKQPVGLRLGFTADPFSYSLDLGLPKPARSAFKLDPELKRECLWRGPHMIARSLCSDRRQGVLRCRSEKGVWRDVGLRLSPQGSMLTEYADPFAAPELILMREIIRSWRFYDTFRTDVDAPARRITVGTRTPVMSNDGSDLAAALQTIREIGDCGALDRAVDDAFPGSVVRISTNDAGMGLSLEQPGMLRELAAAELSDGTLRFLMLAAALLTPRPPELMVINEPETSLHSDLIPALGRLIIAAAEQIQMVVVTHSEPLIAQLCPHLDCVPIRLLKRAGETIVEDAKLLDQIGWKWPPR